ncbi:helix-turn-helix domain-containing protein [Bradyrhizobium neotropicale]|nr:helix-turn-helix domain-containing protein [Bradyrhizobium neotropicale]
MWATASGSTSHALLRLEKRAGRRIETGIEIDFPISRRDVAEMTGTTLLTVSRILSAWEQQGLVEGGLRTGRRPHSVRKVRWLTAAGDAPHPYDRLRGDPIAEGCVAVTLPANCGFRLVVRPLLSSTGRSVGRIDRPARHLEHDPEKWKPVF